MSKVNFSVARIEAFKCPTGKHQAFLWDSKSPGLGLRATAAGTRSYIFQGKLAQNTIRITIGDTRSWTIEQAQEEARRQQRLIDTGIDPRTHKAELSAAEQNRKKEAIRLKATFREAWEAYISERKPQWGDTHCRDHIRLSATGGDKFKRGTGTTKAGPLSEFLNLPLSSLTNTIIANWLHQQNITRPTATALSFRLLRAFIRWTHETPEYKGLIPADAINSRAVREKVSKLKTKDGDCLQREQLSAWFRSVRSLQNPVQSTYLQGLLITGARREELAALKWKDVDFQWRTLSIKDKIDAENGRTIPLTPYLSSLLQQLQQLNVVPPNARSLERLRNTGREWAPSEWVFFSETSADGKIAEPRIAHNRALEIAELPHLTIHGLRRSFGTLAEWVECPTGVVAQIMGHRPSAIAEKHYRRRPIDLLRMWHDKIESWMLEQANITYT